MQTDDKTIKRWLLALENSYVFFKVTPYFKNLNLALRKAPKFYFYDYPRVTNPRARLENFVALSLLKELSFRNDVDGEDYTLHYLQNRAHHEVDFLICNRKIPQLMIEVKQGDDSISTNFKHFRPALLKQNPKLKTIQLVKNLKRPYSNPEGIQVAELGAWLEKMDF